MDIARILHAGYIFEEAGFRILFDPIFENPFSRNAFAMPEIEFDLAQIRALRPDAVFISHYHDDHLSLVSLDLLARETPVYLFSVHEVFFELIRAMGFTQVHPLDLNLAVEVGPFKVIPRRALDADVDCIFEVRAAGIAVLNLVDSWLDPRTLDQLAARGPWDLVIWPFQTLREIEAICPSLATPASGRIPVEWEQPLKVLSPRILVPGSCQFRFEAWSWLNHEFFPISYRGFSRQMAELIPGARVAHLLPGSIHRLGPKTWDAIGQVPWVRLKGSFEDYEYRPAVKPPPTAEIAQHFAPLEKDVADQLRRFAMIEIPQRCREFGADSFFGKRSWVWALVIHGTGGAERFNYAIEGSRFELRSDPLAADVTTEVPAATLWGAIHCGETLTSLYVRVRPSSRWLSDAKFREEFEPLDDPLLRSLYGGDVAHYQRAQLRRITRGQTPFGAANR